MISSESKPYYSILERRQPKVQPILPHFTPPSLLPKPPHFTFSADTINLRRLVTVALLFAAIAISCILLYEAAESIHLPETRTPTSNKEDTHESQLVSDNDSLPSASEELRLERILKIAAMEDKTVILTTLNEAWTTPNSVLDLFLESFRIGEHTQPLLNNLVIIALDQKAFSRCLLVHSHCFLLTTEGTDFSKEAYFMTPEYLEMMWRRIDVLRSILEMGFSFVFTDADVMWFRDPFPHFHADADFQIACDRFSGISDDVRMNLPNGGFNFVRSNNKSIEFYKFWYDSRETYPGLHDQDVLNRIKNSSFVRDIGIKMRFLDTTYFGGFCEPSEDLNQVCTMHANCCLGMGNKLHDLRLLLQDWEEFMSLPSTLKKSWVSSWSVPQNCSVESLRQFHSPAGNLGALMEPKRQEELLDLVNIPNEYLKS